MSNSSTSPNSSNSSISQLSQLSRLSKSKIPTLRKSQKSPKLEISGFPKITNFSKTKRMDMILKQFGKVKAENRELEFKSTNLENAMKQKNEEIEYLKQRLEAETKIGASIMERNENLEKINDVYVERFMVESDTTMKLIESNDGLQKVIDGMRLSLVDVKLQLVKCKNELEQYHDLFKVKDEPEIKSEPQL